MFPSILVLLFLLPNQSFAKNDFLQLFDNKKPIIAAIMVEKDLSSEEKVKKAIRWSIQQIRIAEAQGMDGILFEFRGGKILEPKIESKKYQKMLRISKELVKASRQLVVGVEILWHYPEETIRLAKESGAKFVRIDFFSDEVIVNKKKVPIDSKKIIAYKKRIGAEKVVLLTDIQVKYSEMIDKKIGLDFSAKRARENGSDGLIVTSTKSGRAPSPERPRLAKKGSGPLPVVIGSGFSYKNAKGLLQYADAAIVGTSISVKTGGPLLPKKVAQLMREVNTFRRSQKGKK